MTGFYEVPLKLFPVILESRLNRDDRIYNMFLKGDVENNIHPFLFKKYPNPKTTTKAPIVT